jgi:hypothetical protein
VNAPRIAHVKSSNRKVLNEMVSIIVMRLVPAATQVGRGVAIKGVTVKETLNGIRLWRMTLGVPPCQNAQARTKTPAP